MTTPPPIFDADELRAKALAAHASWMGNGRKWYPLSSLTDVLDAEDSAFIEAASPTVTIALLDERATLLARVEAAEAAARDHWRTVCDLRRRLADETGEGLP